MFTRKGGSSGGKATARLITRTAVTTGSQQKTWAIAPLERPAGRNAETAFVNAYRNVATLSIAPIRVEIPSEIKRRGLVEKKFHLFELRMSASEMYPAPNRAILIRMMFVRPACGISKISTTSWRCLTSFTKGARIIAATPPRQ
jgi:hypothetical protein